MGFYVIKREEPEKWQSTLERFANNDVYYSHAYVSALSLHGDGEPLLIHYKEPTCEIAYAVLKSDIAEVPCMRGLLKSSELYDLSTPYGYGGFLYQGEVTKTAMQNFFKNLQRYCQENSIVSQFIRFHPLLQNQKLVQDFCDIVKWKSTIYMDTTSTEKILANMSSKNRNMLRKAQKSGITIECDQGENLDQFIDIYGSTMLAKNADDYYYFKREYFEYMINNMPQNLLFFHARLQGQIISSAIILYTAHFAHYHLSGTKTAYKNLAPGNLLLYQVALWASSQGIKSFHLGGGIEPEDSLFSFKKAFNKNGYLDFYIGRNIFLPQKFSYLVDLRAKNDRNFDLQNKLLIKYRAPNA